MAGWMKHSGAWWILGMVLCSGKSAVLNFTCHFAYLPSINIEAMHWDASLFSPLLCASCLSRSVPRWGCFGNDESSDIPTYVVLLSTHLIHLKLGIRMTVSGHSIIHRVSSSAPTSVRQDPNKYTHYTSRQDGTDLPEWRDAKPTYVWLT